MDEFAKLRDDMVREQIASRGIRSRGVLEAMRKVKRHLFVPQQFINEAYNDHPLPIGMGQTISQPYMVALMTEVLDVGGAEKLLEIGTGSGYQTAILAELTNHVYSVERDRELVEYAEQRLLKLGYRNAEIYHRDGTEGLPQHAPFPRIMVTAASRGVPEPLFDQLEEGGKMVIPIGLRFSQELMLIRKVKDRMESEFVCGCVFVALVGKHGWAEE